jgi:hypothetical protein
MTLDSPWCLGKMNSISAVSSFLTSTCRPGTAVVASTSTFISEIECDEQLPAPVSSVFRLAVDSQLATRQFIKIDMTSLANPYLPIQCSFIHRRGLT